MPVAADGWVDQGVPTSYLVFLPDTKLTAANEVVWEIALAYNTGPVILSVTANLSNLQ